MRFISRHTLHLVILLGYLGSISANASNKPLETISIEYVAEDIIIHVVAKGETVYSIASTYNIAVKDIYRLNPDCEKGIKVGDRLKIARPSKPLKYSNHLIEAKETLYSVARMYKISVDDLKNANPGLEESSFHMGKTIRIPIFEITDSSKSSESTKVDTTFPSKYTVKKKDTLFRIAKTFNVSETVLKEANPVLKDKGLKEGMILTIPSQVEDRSVSLSENTVVTESNKTLTDVSNTFKVGILFPFIEGSAGVQKEKIAEYYEGFLLALKSLKEQGLNAEVYTFDIGAEKNTKKLESLLGTTEINSLDMIIGGISKQQISVLSKFSKKTGIKYVVPFASVDHIDNTPSVFQMTTSHSNLYSQIISAFIERFGRYNIIFISEAGSDNNKSDFVSDLQKELVKSKIQYKTTGGSVSLINDIQNSLDASTKNILVPTSSSEMTLKRIFEALGSVSGADFVSLFGYPEWQTYSQSINELHKYDSYIYSIFFLDEQQRNVQDMSAEYKSWYNKNIINSYPKYGFLGYDTGLYFLTAYNKYKSKIDQNITDLKVNTLQSAISFKRSSANGGFMNNGVYFIHYKTDSSIEKTNVSK